MKVRKKSARFLKDETIETTDTEGVRKRRLPDRFINNDVPLSKKKRGFTQSPTVVSQQPINLHESDSDHESSSTDQAPSSSANNTPRTSKPKKPPLRRMENFYIRSPKSRDYSAPENLDWKKSSTASSESFQLNSGASESSVAPSSELHTASQFLEDSDSSLLPVKSWKTIESKCVGPFVNRIMTIYSS